jgi:hypothetical protein
MTSYGQKRALMSAVALALAGVAGVAHASCAGGKMLKGNFGVTIAGPVVGQSTAELYNGLLTADGQCGLSGSVTGGIFGQPSVTQAVTGSYSVPKHGQATLTFPLPDSGAAVVFDIGLVTDGKFSDVTGIASNGPAVATVEFVEMPNQTYGPGSLSGAYVATCAGAGNDGSGGFGSEVVDITFDGAGHLKASSAGNNNGHAFTVSLTGTYTVSADGAFTVQDGDPYTQFTAAGEIVAGGAELRDVLLQSGSGGGPYRACVVKKQG